MKNKAKCKLCNDILESFHRFDYVQCKCGEIAIDGGNEILNCYAKDFTNFLRVDNKGNEIITTVVDKKLNHPIEDGHLSMAAPTKEEKIEMLEMMVNNIENLPKEAMSSYINHYDLYSALATILSVLKHKDE